MSFEQIIAGIESLAKSQGFYGRLLEKINSLNDSDRNALKIIWEGQNFKDIVDFIMYIEG